MDEVKKGLNEVEEALECSLGISTKGNEEVDVEEEEEEGGGDGDEEEEEDDDDDDNEGEGNYMFRFKDGINPFDFVEDNATSGVQPYEQFERLEYEALAEKKRKLLANSQW